MKTLFSLIFIFISFGGLGQNFHLYLRATAHDCSVCLQNIYAIDAELLPNTQKTLVLHSQEKQALFELYKGFQNLRHTKVIYDDKIFEEMSQEYLVSNYILVSKPDSQIVHQGSIKQFPYTKIKNFLQEISEISPSVFQENLTDYDFKPLTNGIYRYSHLYRYLFAYFHKDSLLRPIHISEDMVQKIYQLHEPDTQLAQQDYENYQHHEYISSRAAYNNLNSFYLSERDTLYTLWSLMRSREQKTDTMIYETISRIFTVVKFYKNEVLEAIPLDLEKLYKQNYHLSSLSFLGADAQNIYLSISPERHKPPKNPFYFVGKWTYKKGRYLFKQIDKKLELSNIFRRYKSIGNNFRGICQHKNWYIFNIANTLHNLKTKQHIQLPLDSLLDDFSNFDLEKKFHLSFLVLDFWIENDILRLLYYSHKNDKQINKFFEYNLKTEKVLKHTSLPSFCQTSEEIHFINFHAYLYKNQEEALRLGFIQF